MKRIIIPLTFFILLILSSCKKESEKPVMLVPDGTPLLSVLNLIDDSDNETNMVDIKLTEPSMLEASFSLKDNNIALLPTVSALKLYKQGLNLKLVTINVLGSLYLVGNKEGISTNDLKGEIIYTTVGTTLSLIEYILNKNNITYSLDDNNACVKIVPLNNGSEIVQAIKKQGGYGVLGEPLVTKSLSIGLKISMDLNDEYRRLSGNEIFPQAGIAIKGSFLDKNKNFVNNLIKKLESNSKFLDDNISRIPDILKSVTSSISSIEYNKQLINRARLSLLYANSYKSSLNAYFKIVANQEVGDDFFYE